MASHEEIEKIRQEIMRFHELLHVMRQQLEAGEQAYSQLFSHCSAEDQKNLKEKDLQWKVAQELVADVSPLRTAVMQMRFDARNLERAFEDLYDIIATSNQS